METVPLLRGLKNVHSHDVVAMQFSNALSLIATGDSNGQIRVWDFQFFSLEKPLFPCITDVEITALAFVEPYPLLLSADTAGDIWVWRVRRPEPSSRASTSAGGAGAAGSPSSSSSSSSSSSPPMPASSSSTFQQPLAILDVWNANFFKAKQEAAARQAQRRGSRLRVEEDEVPASPEDCQITSMKVGGCTRAKPPTHRWCLFAEYA